MPFRSLQWPLIPLVLCLVALGSANARAQKPNIVLIVADDLGWRDLSCMGSRFYETPNIDGLARQGMLFTDAYANAPNCAPSRACLMSGQYGPRHGVFTVGNPNRGQADLRRLIAVPSETVLGDRFITIGETLQAAGYRTATIGKWHLGDDPTTQGFHVNVGGNKAGHPKTYFSPYRNDNLKDGPKGEYLVDRMASEAVNFIATDDARPFFLYLTHYAVHTPIQAKDEDMAPYRDKAPDRGQKNAKYAGMIAALDRGVGRVLAALERTGQGKNTLVVFTSDNGGHMGATSCRPLRGAKGTLYEGGIRVPMLVRWPGRVKAGTRSSTPVMGFDLYPTFVEAAATSTPKDYVLDGTSLVPLLTGGALPERTLHWHFPAYLQGRFEGDAFRTRPGAVVRRGRWKLIEFFEDGRRELYDLGADLSERADLARAHPEKVEELHGLMKRWRAAVKAPVPTERNPRFDPAAKPRRGRRGDNP